jgi:hypothetical protein
MPETREPNPIPAEALQAAAVAVRDARCGHAAGRWACFSCRAEVALEAAAPVLAAQERAACVAEIHTIVAEVRQGTAERIAAAIAGTPKPEEAYWRAWAARIARQIGEAHDDHR